MANIISFNDCQIFDYESAIDEVEVLVPKYLESLKFLEEFQSFEEIPVLLKNVISYWKRLSFLLNYIQGFEEDANLQSAILNSLQSELSILEKIYLKINERICLPKRDCVESLWFSADCILDRMDILLEGMGFYEDHKDRLFIRKIKKKNYLRKESL